MKAVYFERHGAPDVMKYGDLPDPQPAKGEILVDIHAASINGADWKVLEGESYGQVPHFPYVLGRDFSGTVAALGDGVDEFAVGDAVFGVCDRGQEGTYAERIAMKASITARKPAEVSHVDAAALALTGLTAIISVEETLKLEAGETILIQGGAGGVASFAIQLAKHIGAKVITTTSPRNMDYVRSLGADEIIDYTAQDFRDVVSDVDCVFETVGGDVTPKSFEVVRSGGRVASIASGAKAYPSPRADVESLRPAVGRDRPHLEQILDLYRSGAVRLPEITTYPLSEAARALEVSKGRHLQGKLVLTMR